MGNGVWAHTMNGVVRRLIPATVLLALALSTLLVSTQAFAAFEPLVTCGNKISYEYVGDQICYTGECTVCDVQVLAMQVLKFLVTFSVLVAALLFVNAGVLYVMSPANTGNVGKAHKIFTSTLVGLIIILAAYLLIDTIMRALYSGGASWGPWNEFLCQGDTGTRKYCVEKMKQVTLKGGAEGGTGPGTGPVTTLPVNSRCVSTNDACSIGTCTSFATSGDCMGAPALPLCTSVPKEASTTTPCITKTCSQTIPENPSYCAGDTGGNKPKGYYCSGEFLKKYFPADKLSVASCVCYGESGGVVNIGSGPDKCEPSGVSVSWGLFQINLTTHHIDGLDCKKAFSGGPYTASDHTCAIIDPMLFETCKRAASNPDVNVRNAVRIMNEAGGWGPWGAFKDAKCGG